MIGREQYMHRYVFGYEVLFWVLEDLSVQVKDAFREGFVNALVHRDYFRVGAVQVQLQKNILSISSSEAF